MILLDTHVVLWLASDPARVSARAMAAIREARRAGGGMAISDITLLELAALARKGRLELTIAVETLLQEVEARFVVVPLNARICARTISLPQSYPKDPADRVIAATALVEGLSLLTADRRIRRSKAVPTLW